MIAALLLMLAAQDVPAPAAIAAPVEDDGEIVVQATYGTTTMLFDKGMDNKLRNCRVMVSSGSQRRDTNACQATPVCFAKTAEIVTDCVALTSIEPVTAGPKPPAFGSGGPQVFTMPKLVQPKPAPQLNIAGPQERTESRDTDRQRVKPLPPPPTAPSNGGVVTMRVGDGQNSKENP